MEMDKHTIIELTNTVLRKYYQGQFEPLFSILAKDCTWTSVGHQTVRGKQEIEMYLNNHLIMPLYEMKDIHFEVQISENKSHIVVIGEYTLHIAKETNGTNEMKQVITFCYRRKKDGYEVYHMHVSSVLSEFLLFNQMQTQYAKRLMAQTSGQYGQKVMLHFDGATQFINPNTVLYVEATDKTCVLHMLDCKRKVNKGIRQIEEVFPSYFCRTHRSYLVNIHYIEKVERYQLTLIQNLILPIPEKKYMEIKEKIQNIFQSENKIF